MRLNTPRPILKPQRGVAAIEYAIGMLVFFTFLLGVMEVARMTFVWNTMYEVTTRAARAAAMENFNDATAKDALRKRAMFANTLPLDSDIAYSNLVIDYLQADGQTPVSPLPTCPALNLAQCLDTPGSTSCIRFVRVRLCKSGTDCTAMPYHPMAQLPGMTFFNINMPFFTAIVPAESLGMPGACS